ncbi:hypothetical protein IMG5_188490 [Ichthyophthirius multifiliis]|uniref:Peptidase S11 D-alanyl-D-alanine carboxypeptidase A N-terminal domain-containing protein n=1 Tax=Ichthyophthirius multifiliis TaxID=5932 RepID=G0R3Z2_ICHMU|nr:hypothetical protein IMG5_188490 [Ichthyophthirius multifiliis]EGR27823.1 hypothetical protein IMG5_188490 [Ichthyophthirius multifiliis]|eukprot:XP_004027168.1 hypothetical protein IMG5_188490 [Ichthyophthirius multifiliis]
MKRNSYQAQQVQRENRIFISFLYFKRLQFKSKFLIFYIEQINKLKQKPPQISAKSWIIINAKNKQVIGGYQESTIREIASLTKMMTLFLSIYYMRQMNIIPEKTYFKVSQHAANIKGTSAELKKGDLVSIYDLLHGLMLPSGNDAAIVLAENFGVYIFIQSEEFKEKYGIKSINKKNQSNFFFNEKIILFIYNKYFYKKVRNPIMYFIREMNRQAQKFSMFDTYFTNPHGLVHKKNRSSAYDAGQLSLQMIYDPLIKEVVQKQQYQAEIYDSQQELKRKIIWKNTNQLLKKGFSGLKTGITCNAGPCLASWFKNNQYSLIVVLLNCKSIKDRWKETIEIIEWAIKYSKENEQK